jgi:hypothetical protein
MACISLGDSKVLLNCLSTSSPTVARIAELISASVKLFAFQTRQHLLARSALHA